MARSQGEWAQKLSQAFNSWLEETGHSRKEIATELEIPSSSLFDMLNRGVVSPKVERYAAIFHRTGIQEADPRTIPQPENSTAKSAYPWSEEQWAQWLQDNGFEFTRDEESTVKVENSTYESRLGGSSRYEEDIPGSSSKMNSQPTMGEIIGTFFDQLMDSFGRQVAHYVQPTESTGEATQLVAELRREVERMQIMREGEEVRQQELFNLLQKLSVANAANLRSRDIGQLADELYDQLRQAARTPKTSEQVRERYASSLMRLLSLAELFTSSKEELQEKLEQMRVVGSI